MVFKSPFSPVPISNETLHEKLLRAVWHHGTVHPTKPCLVSATDPEKFLTFHEYYTQVHSVCAFLRSRGFKNGDVACLVLANTIEWPVFHLGAMAAGGAISGASALFTDYELERQFIDSRCTVVFTDDAHLEKVLKAVSNCDKIKTVICLRSGGTHQKRLPGHIIEWDEIISFRPQYDIAKVDPGQMAILPYSSGTTGSPKGVMLSHRNFSTMVELFKDHVDREIFSTLTGNHSWYQESFILNLPFYHQFGFGVLNTSLLTGATAVVMDKFEPKTFLAAIERYRTRLLFIVPPILIFLAKHPIVNEYDISSIEFVLTGAAPAGKDICEEFLARHKHVRFLCQGYGMTECGMASHLPRLVARNDSYLGVGMVAATFEQKIIDISTGKEVGVGERGEICVRGPTIMMGYLNRPDATAETIDKQGWLHTGDIGYTDKDGRTFIIDRLKELIKVKGLQVPPAELEDLLLSHPLVRDVAIIGLPDEKRGELVRAYVVRASVALSEDDVVKFVSHKVSEYKHITGGVKFVEEIPKSAAGKILRKDLRAQAAKEMKEVKSKL